MTHIFYSFLTLAEYPNPGAPPIASWNGRGIYESMTRAEIMDVLGTPRYGAHDWQKQKMDGMMSQAERTGKKWIWSIGGWSDLTLTIQKNQINNFVKRCVDLLKKGGDGIDFDWEHLSQDMKKSKAQIETLALTLLKLR